MQGILAGLFVGSDHDWQSWLFKLMFVPLMDVLGICCRPLRPLYVSATSSLIPCQDRVTFYKTGLRSYHTLCGFLLCSHQVLFTPSTLH